MKMIDSQIENEIDKEVVNSVDKFTKTNQMVKEFYDMLSKFSSYLYNGIASLSYNKGNEVIKLYDYVRDKLINEMDEKMSELYGFKIFYQLSIFTELIKCGEEAYNELLSFYNERNVDIDYEQCCNELEDVILDVAKVIKNIISYVNKNQHKLTSSDSTKGISIKELLSNLNEEIELKQSQKHTEVKTKIRYYGDDFDFIENLTSVSLYLLDKDLKKIRNNIVHPILVTSKPSFEKETEIFPSFFVFFGPFNEVLLKFKLRGIEVLFSYDEYVIKLIDGENEVTFIPHLFKEMVENRKNIKSTDKYFQEFKRLLLMIEYLLDKGMKIFQKNI